MSKISVTIYGVSKKKVCCLSHTLPTRDLPQDGQRMMTKIEDEVAKRLIPKLDEPLVRITYYDQYDK